MQLDSAASRPRPSHAALLLSGDTDSWAADSETSAFHALGHCDGHLAQPRLAPPSVPQPSVGEPRRQTPAPDGGCRGNPPAGVSDRERVDFDEGAGPFGPEFTPLRPPARGYGA